MDYPVSVTPYRMWDAASFNGGYAAVSKVMGFAPFELRDAKAPRGLAGDGISPAALSFYTEIDEATRTRLEPIAREATASAKTYYDTVVDAVAFFRDGEYRYSLKPGIAPDGDQLGYFLFTSKKGIVPISRFRFASRCDRLEYRVGSRRGSLLAPIRGPWGTTPSEPTWPTPGSRFLSSLWLGFI
jgi:hypothetical protein